MAEFDNRLFESEEERTNFLVQLRMLGAASVEVSYSGSGDSGQVDSVCLFNATGKPIDISGQTFPWREEEQIYENGKWVMKITPKPNMSLEDVLKNMVYTATENYDWVNNDGGQGSLRIDLTQSPVVIEVHHETNITEIETDEMEF